MTVKDPYAGPPSLTIPTDVLAHIALLAHAYDAQIQAVDPDDGSNPSDDRSVQALEPGPDNPTGRELAGAIRGLNEEQRAALVALVWVGREDFEPEEWQEAVAAARERRADGPTERYLLSLSLLGEYIENGADSLGFSLAEDETGEIHHPAGEAPAEDDRE